MIDNDELRRRAEEIFTGEIARSPEKFGALSPEEMRRTFYELRVHQIELEMQNEELRRSQLELDALRARYFELYDLAPVGYLSVGEDGLIPEANLTATTLLGETRGALVTQRFSRFIHKEDQNTYYLRRKQLFESGTQQAWEMRMVKKDGTVFWAQLEAVIVREEDGSSVLSVVLSDITERKTAERLLKESEERFRQLFDHMADGVAVYQAVEGGLDFVLVDINEPGQSMGKFRLDEVAGRRLTGIFPSAERTGLLDAFRRVLETGMTEVFPLTEYADDRIQRWMEYFILMLPSGLIAAVFSDITERKRSEEKILMMNARSEQQALTDFLTDLFNRRYFMQRGDDEFKRAKRNNQPLSLLMVDIDEFKTVNDTWGHEAGDSALKLVAAALKSSLREIDILGRIGGEEFAVILPNTALEAAGPLAERVRQTVAETSYTTPLAPLGAITISVGLAAFTNGMSGIDDLLRNADTALYRAKNGGRNRVGVYEDRTDGVPDITVRE